VAASRTRTLLLLLAGAAALTASVVAAGEALGKLAAARADVERLEARFDRLREDIAGAAGAETERDALRTEVAALAARRYDAGAMNPYAFATLVKARLSSLGVAVRRYQVVDGGANPCVEVEAAGSVRSLVAFLHAVSRDEKLWVVPSFTLAVSPEDGSADAQFRIGYAMVDAADR
jgi:hypothetical protein